ncbi:protein phosphatase 2C domain-containing protein [Streptomyces sp. NBC_01239]|uniref:protein phosphatase 2C domain-containing protein n=1 Tax=Streptomyces sp. NBC_01239 TaxID=2903792 RepID=UPI0022530097|nr:protein phosphatase 2C domain-containing protein [Streptomyces sp. NBC_01239]MCX4814772.1 protein phosphatase 2C domain-containing protein [Streptomyces sp. NBC_01239]
MPAGTFPPAYPQRPTAPAPPADSPAAPPGGVRPDGLSTPRSYPEPSAIPAPPADDPAASPGGLRPGGPSASQSPAAPRRPADDPVVSPQSLRADGTPSPRPYPEPSAIPAPPADDPAVAPGDFRPDGFSAPQQPAAPPRPADDPAAPPGNFRPDGPPSPPPYPQPPAAAPGLPTPAQQSLRPARPLRPYDPRPFPQPPAAVPLADNPASAQGDLRPDSPSDLGPYPQPPVLPAADPAPQLLPATPAPPPPPLTLDYVGSGPPTYDAEPTALPPADPDELDDLVADTVLDGARYGASTIRAASVRGDSARFRGEPRRDSLLTARFGVGEQALVLVAMATGARATPGAHRAAAEACHWIARAVGRSHARLSEDIRAARRGDLKSGLHRLTDRSLGKLRASAAEQGIDPEEYSAGLRCLLLPADPECRTRVFFGVGPGGLFRLRDGEWQDIEPSVADAIGEAVVGFGSQPAETPEGDRLTMDFGIPTPPSPYEPAPEPPREPFRFRASVARPGDALLMCTGGLAEPLRGEPELSAHLAGRWSGTTPPGLAAFLADTQVRVKGYADDRTAAAVWEA